MPRAEPRHSCGTARRPSSRTPRDRLVRLSRSSRRTPGTRLTTRSLFRSRRMGRVRPMPPNLRFSCSACRTLQTMPIQVQFDDGNMDRAYGSRLERQLSHQRQAGDLHFHLEPRRTPGRNMVVPVDLAGDQPDGQHRDCHLQSLRGIDAQGHLCRQSNSCGERKSFDPRLQWHHDQFCRFEYRDDCGWSRDSRPLGRHRRIRGRRCTLGEGRWKHLGVDPIRPDRESSGLRSVDHQCLEPATVSPDHAQHAQRIEVDPNVVVARRQ